MKFSAFAVAALIAFSPALHAGSAALAQDSRTEIVRFSPGSTGTVIRDRITGREYVVYKVGAQAGQFMSVSLTSDNTATYFNVYAPGRGPGDEALAVGDQIGDMMTDLNRFAGPLPASGDYSISVYLFRSAARRGEASNYQLDIQIGAGDFADGLAGGPDYWEVTGVSAGDMLNLRERPNAQSAVLDRLANGIILRNLGCSMEGGQKWCQVESIDGRQLRGWVSGRYLQESGFVPDNAGGSADAKVPGTDFNATGPLPCARYSGQPMGECQFGVIREGNGSGNVTIFWPEGGSRVIFFENGTPVSFDQSQADGNIQMTFERQSDLTIIRIGEERFEIIDAILFGG